MSNGGKLVENAHLDANGSVLEADLDAGGWIANARRAAEGPQEIQDEDNDFTKTDAKENANASSSQQAIDLLYIFFYLIGEPSFVTSTPDELQSPSVLKCYCFECDCCSGYLGNCYEIAPQCCMLSFAYICCCPATVGFSKLCRFRDTGGYNQCHSFHYWCCEERYEEMTYSYDIQREGGSDEGETETRTMKELEKKTYWITTGDFKRRTGGPI